jgi:hypothetical protein
MKEETMELLASRCEGSEAVGHEELLPAAVRLLEKLELQVANLIEKQCGSEGEELLRGSLHEIQAFLGRVEEVYPVE